MKNHGDAGFQIVLIYSFFVKLPPLINLKIGYFVVIIGSASTQSMFAGLSHPTSSDKKSKRIKMLAMTIFLMASAIVTLAALSLPTKTVVVLGVVGGMMVLASLTFLVARALKKP